jgi:hypothetical protein
LERPIRRLAACALLATLAACEPLSLAALGVGGSAAVNHKVSSTPYRTFTAPLPKVRYASLAALTRMGMKTGAVSRLENGELIFATATNRDVEVELEAVTPSATRMRVVVAREGGGWLYDGSTANEIIMQTAKQLGI